MIVDRSIVDKTIEKKLDRYCVRKDYVKTMTDAMMSLHGITAKEAMDVIALRKSISEIDIFMLFCVSEAIGLVEKKDYLSKWFSESEIASYTGRKLEIDKIKFPIYIDAFKVTENHFITTTDLQFFMKLRRAQLICYNANVQRTMTRVLRGGEEAYKISLNAGAVADICYEMEHDEYIPNTITLRIPPDESEFYYDEKKNRLVIQKLDAFEVADGFHRYIAMCQANDSNPEFNIPMELRIISYSETKTRQFIWQEDQKTRMEKLDSRSMNTNAGSNIICEALNEDPMFNLRGSIKRNGGQIPFAEFSFLIDRMYFKGVKRDEEKAIIIKVKKKIRDFFNYLTEEDEKYLTKKYDLAELLIILCIIESGDVKNAGNIIEKAKVKITEDVNVSSKISRKSITDSTIKKVKSIIEEVR